MATFVTYEATPTQFFAIEEDGTPDGREVAVFRTKDECDAYVAWRNDVDTLALLKKENLQAENALRVVERELSAILACQGWREELQGPPGNATEWIGPRLFKALIAAREGLAKEWPR